MGRLRGFASFFKIRDTPMPSSPSSSSSSSSSSKSTSSLWTIWPSCKKPSTPSFLAADVIDKGTHKMMSPVYVDYSGEESWFGESPAEEGSDSFSTTSSEEEDSWDVETMISELHGSDQLLFEPSASSKSSPILEELKEGEGSTLSKESVVMAVESGNPYQDFRESMEQMVVEHGLMEWEGLEKLLHWYLDVNGEESHGVIRQAFVDMVLDLVFSAASSCSSSPSSSV